jgi:hypothetical protein
MAPHLHQSLDHPALAQGWNQLIIWCRRIPLARLCWYFLAGVGLGILGVSLLLLPIPILLHISHLSP